MGVCGGPGKTGLIAYVCVYISDIWEVEVVGYLPTQGLLCPVNVMIVRPTRDEEA